MKALVTGAGGFIGRHLCRRLAEAGIEVHGLSRRTRPADTAAASWRSGDLVQFETAHRALDDVRPDWIFHLASHVTGERDLAAVLPTFHGNLTSTVNILAAATELGCQRLVLVGSLEEPEVGTADSVPASPYAASKWAASGYGEFFHANYQTPVVVARLFMVYGPEQEDLRKLLPYATLSFLRGEAPHLTSGSRQIDWIYVDDAVAGLLAAARGEGLEGTAVDLGSGTPCHHPGGRGASGALHRNRRGPALRRDPATAPQERVRVADAAATEARTGWRNPHRARAGLQRTVDWYRRALKEGNVGTGR